MNNMDKKNKTKKRRYRLRDMKPWERTKFITVFLSYFAVAFIFLSGACADLIDSNLQRNIEWDDDIKQDPAVVAEAAERGAGATKVLCGRQPGPRHGE